MDADTTGVDRSDVEQATSLSMTVTTPDQLAGLRRGIRRWLAPSLASDHGDEVLLACGEALANAFEHGRPPVSVEMRWQHDHGTRTLYIAIGDTGGWRVSAEADSRGLGIPIMTAMMDTVSIDTVDGTEVRLARQF